MSTPDANERGWNPWGIPVVVSPLLPMAPSPGEEARRIVRHGMADVLRWLGEEVGPAPEDRTEMLLIGGTLHASARVVGRLSARTPRHQA